MVRRLRFAVAALTLLATPPGVTAQQVERPTLDDLMALHDLGGLVNGLAISPDGRSAAIFRRLKDVGGGPELHNVLALPGIFGLAVQMTPRFYGEAKNLLLAALSSEYQHPKVAIAVDADVDIFNPLELLWALATRVDPQRDADHVLPWRALGVEVEDAPVGKGEARHPAGPDVERDRPEIRQHGFLSWGGPPAHRRGRSGRAHSSTDQSKHDLVERENGAGLDQSRLDGLPETDFVCQQRAP